MSEAPVTVTLTTETQSGNATVKATITFGTADLESALRLIRVATNGAPLLKTPEEGRS
jgi:hypothetical protein